MNLKVKLLFDIVTLVNKTVQSIRRIATNYLFTEYQVIQKEIVDYGLAAVTQKTEASWGHGSRPPIKQGHKGIPNFPLTHIFGWPGLQNEQILPCANTSLVEIFCPPLGQAL